MSSFLKRLFGRRQSTEQAEKAVPPESLPQQSDAAEPVEPVAVDSFDIDVAATSAVTTPEKADVLQSEAPQSDNDVDKQALPILQRKTAGLRTTVLKLLLKDRRSRTTHLLQNRLQNLPRKKQTKRITPSYWTQ